MLNSAEGAVGFGPLGPWARRYLVQDFAGWLGAVLLGVLAHGVFGGLFGLAIGATVGENLGFYGAAWVRESLQDRRAGSLRSGVPILSRIIQEFAVAEVLDLIIRPLLVGAATHAVESAVLGITLGGYAADFVFYSVAGSRALASPSSASDSSPLA